MTMTQTRNTAVDTVNEATEHAKDAGGEVAETTRSTVDQVRDGVGGAMDRMPDVMEAARSGVETARTGVEQVAERMPAAVERSRVGACGRPPRSRRCPTPPCGCSPGHRSASRPG